MTLARNSPITVLEKLNSVCWDFKDADTRNNLHTIHPYPAKFIPEIPRGLIKLFHTGDNSAVLDPFCGFGTTLVEAKIAGLASIGVDLHPLATLISSVKTMNLDEPIESVCSSILEKSRRKVKERDFKIPAIPNLNHWFEQPIQEALATLITEIERVPNEKTRMALKVAFSSIVVRVSNQDSDTRYAAVQKNLVQDDVWTNFKRAVCQLGQVLSSDLQLNLLPNQPPVQLINKDIMLVEPNEITRSVGLVVTSPPYPNAYEYWLYHKYRMYWLGIDPIAVKEREIGARAHYFKKNHQTEHDFEEQMSRCFWLLSKVMYKGAYACFIVGRSIIHGREIDNEAILQQAAIKHGFCLAGLVRREISSSRKSFNLSHANIKREAIIVFRLESN